MHSLQVWKAAQRLHRVHMTSQSCMCNSFKLYTNPMALNSMHLCTGSNVSVVLSPEELKVRVNMNLRSKNR
jgi:hypothetical protein